MLHCPTWRCVASPVGYEPHCILPMTGVLQTNGVRRNHRVLFLCAQMSLFSGQMHLICWARWYLAIFRKGLEGTQLHDFKELQGRKVAPEYSRWVSPAILRPKTAWRICRVSSTSSPSDIIASFFELWAKYRLLPQSPMATGDGSSCTLWLFHIAMENGP